MNKSIKVSDNFHSLISEYSKINRIDLHKKQDIYILFKKWKRKTEYLCNISIKDNTVIIEYNNKSYEYINKNIFLQSIKSKIENHKQLNKWYSSNRVIRRKPPYIRNKIIEKGIDYIKSLSRIDFNQKI